MLPLLEVWRCCGIILLFLIQLKRRFQRSPCPPSSLERNTVMMLLFLMVTTRSWSRKPAMNSTVSTFGETTRSHQCRAALSGRLWSVVAKRLDIATSWMLWQSSILTKVRQTGGMSANRMPWSLTWTSSRLLTEEKSFCSVGRKWTATTRLARASQLKRTKSTWQKLSRKTIRAMTCASTFLSSSNMPEKSAMLGLLMHQLRPPQSANSMPRERLLLRFNHKMNERVHSPRSFHKSVWTPEQSPNDVQDLIIKFYVSFKILT